MFRPIAIPTLFAVMIMTCAAEKPSRVDEAFGGTIVSTYPDGRTAKLWLQRDGAYTAQGRRGDPSSGSWEVKGDRLCLKQSRPFPAPFTYCTPIPSAGMGASWSAKAATGEPIRVTLVKGRAKTTGGARAQTPG